MYIPIPSVKKNVEKTNSRAFMYSASLIVP